MQAHPLALRATATACATDVPHRIHIQQTNGKWDVYNNGKKIKTFSTRDEATRYVDRLVTYYKRNPKYNPKGRR